MFSWWLNPWFYGFMISACCKWMKMSGGSAIRQVSLLSRQLEKSGKGCKAQSLMNSGRMFLSSPVNCHSQRLSPLFLWGAAHSCPRCGMTDTHIMHMLWECSAIGKFWTDGLGLTYKVYGVALSAPSLKLVFYVSLGIWCVPNPSFLAFPICRFRPRNSWHSIRFSLLPLH